MLTAERHVIYKYLRARNFRAGSTLHTNLATRGAHFSFSKMSCIHKDCNATLSSTLLGSLHLHQCPHRLFYLDEETLVTSWKAEDLAALVAGVEAIDVRGGFPEVSTDADPFLLVADEWAVLIVGGILGPQPPSIVRIASRHNTPARIRFTSNSGACREVFAWTQSGAGLEEAHVSRHTDAGFGSPPTVTISVWFPRESPTNPRIHPCAFLRPSGPEVFVDRRWLSSGGVAVPVKVFCSAVLGSLRVHYRNSNVWRLDRPCGYTVFFGSCGDTLFCPVCLCEFENPEEMTDALMPGVTRAELAGAHLWDTKTGEEAHTQFGRAEHPILFHEVLSLM